MNDQDVTVQLPAMEPGELLTRPTPEGVWIRGTGPESMGHGIELRGPSAAVLAFVAEYWGKEEAEWTQSLIELGGPR